MLHWRKSMKILVDTNILLDALLGREPYFGNADKIINLCADKKIEGFMAAHSIPNIFYILRKDMSEESRREVLLSLCNILTVEGVDFTKLMYALQNKSFSDLEDCLQSICAKNVKADYIITRNIKDFVNSEVPAILPEDFLIALSENR